MSRLFDPKSIHPPRDLPACDTINLVNYAISATDLDDIKERLSQAASQSSLSNWLCSILNIVDICKIFFEWKVLKQDKQTDFCKHLAVHLSPGNQDRWCTRHCNVCTGRNRVKNLYLEVSLPRALPCSCSCCSSLELEFSSFLYSHIVTTTDLHVLSYQRHYYSHITALGSC